MRNLTEDKLPLDDNPEDRSSNKSHLPVKQQLTAQTKCEKCKHICLSLLIGQSLALLLGASGVCAALLARVNISLPLAQNLPHYTLLAVIFGSVTICRCCRQAYLSSSSAGISPERNSDPVAHGLGRFKRGALFILAGVVDIHAYWATLAAYAYTNVTSIQLLDCLSIPISMLLSFFLLSYRYLWTHYVGAVICIVGACVMVTADVLASNQYPMDTYNLTINGVIMDATQAIVLGDMLAIIGAILYGVSSVLQEYIIQKERATTYLTWCMLVAAMISAIYCAALEHVQLTEIINSVTIHGQRLPRIAIAYFAGYVASMFFLDTLMAFTITRVSAVLINLSLLAADVYSLVAGLFLFHLKFHHLYFVSFALIITGLVFYAVRNAKEQEKLSSESK
ncbi:Solute carrier family 35 member F2 [Paragonimus heterotremus]|uniref:Solute carrier family 35 member F2 n=1 Tax=Paragonimus heterotremus TaxID=100268 RepID=A0A8J4TJC2_9TREM|nr:Solute carrier family 35 member F2 [Paragonimus heterotremus]